MPIFECTLYRKLFGYTKSIPVQFEGRDAGCEVVADTAGKARYSWLLSLRESWPDVKFADIRVRRIKSAEAVAADKGLDLQYLRASMRDWARRVR